MERIGSMLTWFDEGCAHSQILAASATNESVLYWIAVQDLTSEGISASTRFRKASMHRVIRQGDVSFSPRNSNTALLSSPRESSITVSKSTAVGSTSSVPSQTPMPNHIGVVPSQEEQRRVCGPDDSNSHASCCVCASAAFATRVRIQGTRKRTSILFPDDWNSLGVFSDCYCTSEAPSLID